VYLNQNSHLLLIKNLGGKKMFGFFKKKGKKGKAVKKPARKPAKRSGKKIPFGGYSISFAGRKETVEQVFGRGSVTPSEMTKKLWKFVKSRRLSSK